MIAKGQYVKPFYRGKGGKHPIRAAAHLRAHLKYIQYRASGAEEHDQQRTFFSRDREQVTRQEVHADVMARTSSAVCFHKIVLSPADDEPVRDWQEWTRHVLGDLERYQQKHLHWYAVVHQNTAHPHVHVVIAGRAEDDAGQPTTVTMYARRKDQPATVRDDYGLLQQSGREHSDYALARLIARTLDDINALDEISRSTISQQGERSVWR